MVAAEELISLVQRIAEELSDTPEGVKTEKIDVGQDALYIVVRCLHHDVGHLVGKEGRNAKALRTLLKSIAGKRGIKADILITE